MNVATLMSKDVQACSPDDTLVRAAQIMWDSTIGCVPVVDAEHHVVGLLTDRDVAMAAYTQGRALHDIGVQTAMASDVTVCHPEDDILGVEKRMQELRVRRIPVVDDRERLVGMISLGDLAQATARRKGDKAGVSADEIARTLAAVSHPRRTESQTSH